MLACAALTSDDLPMPRAPHSSALLAGRPLAKRSVFSIRMSRIRSMPLSRPRSTRLTCGTGASRPFGCQTKASALPARRRSRPSAKRRTGARQWPPGRARSAPSASCSGAAWDVLSRRARISARRPSRPRGSLFSEAFLTSFGFLTMHPYRAFRKAASGANEGVWQRCNWDRGRYSPREFARTGPMLMRRRFIPVSRGLSEC